MLATVPVTGFVSLADDGRLTDACLVFQLDKPAFDATTGAIVASDPVLGSISESGQVSVSLWPNTRGSQATCYRVSLIGKRETDLPMSHDLGTVTVPETGGDISELLAVGQRGIKGVVATLLSVAEYEKIVEAAGEAQNALSRARDWAASEAEVEGSLKSARAYALESAQSAERSAELHAQASLLTRSGATQIFDTPEEGLAQAIEGENFQVRMGRNLLLYRREGAEAHVQGYLGQIVFPGFAGLSALDYTAVGPGETVQAGPFRYEIAAPDAADHHIETGGVKLYALPMETGEFTARQFGAVEGSDVTDAVQAAIDAALYNVDRDDCYMADVLIDVHVGRLSRTIHCSYGGDSYKTIRVRGLGQTYSDNERSHNGTILTYTATSGPAFAIQGSRKPVLSDFTIYGAASETLKDIGSGKAGGGSAGMLVPENYDARTWDKALWAAGIVPNRRYNPYAAVAIDPRSGDRPLDLAVVAVSVTSPAVITAAAAHNLNSNVPETVNIAGLSGAGITDGAYYAVRVSDTEAELWALDWSATAATQTASGMLSYPYPEAPAYPKAETVQDPNVSKKRTSAFVIERLTIRGFEVGTAINPGTQGSNGDFGAFEHIDTGQCKFGHAVCQANARINHYYRCNPDTVFCFLTTARFGVAGGNANAKIEGMGGGYMVKWFEAPATTRLGATIFDSCHPEGVGMLGTLYTGGSGFQPIVFQNSIVKFKHDTSAPPTVLENFGGDPCPITFVGGEIRSNRGLSFMTRNIKLLGTQLTRQNTATLECERICYNNAHLTAASPATHLGFPVAQRYDIYNGGVSDTVELGEGLVLTGRAHGIPCGARLVSRGARSEAPGMPLVVPPFTFSIGANQRAFGTDPIGARTLSFTLTSQSGARLRQSGLAPGGVLTDQFNGTRLLIRTVNHDTGAVVAEIESNWFDDGNAAGLFDPSWDWTQNAWLLHRTDLFAPPSRIFGDFSAGSNVITNLRTLGRIDEEDFGLGAGDWLAAYYLEAPGVFANDDTSVTAIDKGMGTITLASPARRDAGQVPLDYWLRAI